MRKGWPNALILFGVGSALCASAAAAAPVALVCHRETKYMKEIDPTTVVFDETSKTVKVDWGSYYDIGQNSGQLYHRDGSHADYSAQVTDRVITFGPAGYWQWRLDRLTGQLGIPGNDIYQLTCEVAAKKF